MEPTRITSGDSLEWTRSCGQYPSSAWTLTYYLSQNASDTPVAVVATSFGEDFQAAIDASTTSKLTPGTLRWFARVTDGASVHTIGDGVMEVLPDPTVAYDHRTTEEKCLAAINAVLEKRMGDSIVEYELPNGVKAKHLPHADLLKLKAHYEAAVRRQQTHHRGLHSIPVAIAPFFGGRR